MCVRSLRYSACNAHVPYCHLWPTPIYNIFPHFLANGTIVEKKMTGHVTSCTYRRFVPSSVFFCKVLHFCGSCVFIMADTSITLGVNSVWFSDTPRPVLFTRYPLQQTAYHCSVVQHSYLFQTARQLSAGCSCKHAATWMQYCNVLHSSLS